MSVQVPCTDMEDYARIFNEGFDEARRQLEADVRTAGVRALKDAAAEQRRLAEESRTNNGQAEHEDIADWLEERADEIPGRPLHCPVGCDEGACETCPCCCAGFCVYGLDGLPEDPEDVGRWLEIAARHNPVAGLLRAQLKPAPAVTDEVSFAAVRGFEQRPGYSKLERMRDALEAALPLLGPRPLFDREAVKKLVQDELAVHLAGTPALVHLQMLVGPRVADAVLELARPMPTREQIAKAVYVSESRANSYAPTWEASSQLVQELFYDIADAVVALLKGGQS